MPFVSIRKAKLKASNKRPAASTDYSVADGGRSGFKNAYKAGVNDVLSDGALEELVAAMSDSDTSAISTILHTDQPGFAKMQARLEAQYQQLLQDSGNAEVARSSFVSAFNVDNPHSQAWIDNQTSRLTDQLGKDAAHSVQKIVSNGLLDGVPPREMAKQLKAQIGLHPRESDAVDRRYQSSLDAGVPRSRALKMREQYASDLLDQRAETIARTETIAAEAAGQQSAWKEAQGSGLLADDTQRTWIASSDVRTCPICEELDGQVVGLDEPFVDSNGDEVMHPPRHPRCRCTVGIVG